ncbi:MAG: DUF2007 domain-containing protein [Flavobacteriaceae bacterium]|nr:DUF2007 domain-containing protein [Flavobacteriaceae bacterium]MCB0474520.1 DUF2007 domain-containing protein [Flavobacteriaceae bacterium]
MDTNTNKLRIVFRSHLIHEIYIAKAKLENYAIKSFLADEHLNYTIGTAFIEEYKLMVADSDYERARTLLSLYKT